MIVYFADRQLNVIGQASTELPEGLIITSDKKTEDVETGVAVFDCVIPFDKKTRAMVEEYAELGNYILRNHDGENELYTITDVEIDTKKQEVYLYAEDDGMDLLNEIVGKYEADKAYPISHYIDKYAVDAGFVIGINEVKDLTRKLAWDGESTATERIASIATQFDGCEISYSFEVDRLNVVKKFINIYKERGKDLGITLRLNQDVDSIITTKSITNLATALQCVGGTPEDENIEDDVEPTPITLAGYKYDDGDFYVDGAVLKSREALKRWSRFLWKTDEAQKSGGHIVKQFSYDTLSQATLCAHAITELKKIREMEINYKVDITKFPKNVKIGDRINIVDDAGELYVSARVLQLETSVADQEAKATLGEYLIKSSGIHQKVVDLAAQFAKMSLSAARALSIANSAKTAATNAQTQAHSALEEAANAQAAVEGAVTAANTATQSAQAAQEKADNAKAAVDKVEKDVESLNSTVVNAQTAAEQARQAAQTAEVKAEEAKQAATNAQTKANEVTDSVKAAQTKAESAIAKAEAAESKADLAKADAEEAATTAMAAKQDAEQAQRDIDSLGEDLTTLSNTLSVDYARKTDLTETEASLQTQIAQNAAEISSTAKKVQKIDETTNDAQKTMLGALAWAEMAQDEADKAAIEAESAQAAADTAMADATAAQAEADTAKAAANTARNVWYRAEADLAVAKADFETVSSRADATEEEIAAAHDALEAAQTTATEARENALAAIQSASEAQSVANTAAANAERALTSANLAASNATLAQQVADEARGDAEAARLAADEASEIAAEAQRTASTAVENANAARTVANEAMSEAEEAQRMADEADAKVAQITDDLAAAEQRLADVLANADATAEEVEAAQADVEAAENAANVAQAEADAAQEAADSAMTDAITAQTVADEAAEAADQARANAREAQAAADQAKGIVNGLAVRIADAETKIIQNADRLALTATKTEVAEMLGGYSTTEEMRASIELEADSIRQTVSATYATKEEVTETVDAAVEETNNSLQEQIVTQSTEVLNSSQQIIMNALESYVETSDHEAFRQTVESELQIMANKIAMDFESTIEQITNVNGDLQAVIENLEKHFEFSADGLTIRAGANSMNLILDNDVIRFVKNGQDFGWWDGINFHTGNLYVDVNEIAQFGNYGFVPYVDDEMDGLDLVRVGG